MLIAARACLKDDSCFMFTEHLQVSESKDLFAISNTQPVRGYKHLSLNMHHLCGGQCIFAVRDETKSVHFVTCFLHNINPLTTAYGAAGLANLAA